MSFHKGNSEDGESFFTFLIYEEKNKIGKIEKGKILQSEKASKYKERIKLNARDELQTKMAKKGENNEKQNFKSELSVFNLF